MQPIFSSLVSLFKSNNPLVVIFYIPYIILFKVSFFFGPFDAAFIADHHEPLSKLFFAPLQSVSNLYPLLSLCLSGLLCFIQALLVNQIINANKILPRKAYVGGLFFIIFSCLFKESLFLSSASLALTFVILSIERLFSLFKKDKASSEIYDVGFFLAIATLFYFPSISFLLLSFIGLATIRPFAYNEWISLTLGFLSPFFVTFVYYFWHDNQALLPSDIMNLRSGIWMKTITMDYLRWSMIGTVSLLTLILLVMVPATLYSSVIQVRKFITIMVVFVIFVGISFFLQQSISLSHFIFLSLPLSILSSLVAMQLKNKVILEVVHLILILLVLTGHFLPVFNLI